MTAYASLRGRAVADAVQRETRNGKPMATCRLAVDVERESEGGGDSAPWWITALAFGRLAASLAAVQKGDPVSVTGRLERSHFTGRDGQEREGWTCIADALVCARAAKPNPADQSPPSGPGGVPDDEIPF